MNLDPWHHPTIIPTCSIFITSVAERAQNFPRHVNIEILPWHTDHAPSPHSLVSGP